MNTARVRIAGFLAVAALAVGASLDADSTSGALWSRGAACLGWDGPLRCVKVPSPDGRKTVFVGADRLDVAVGDKLLTATSGFRTETLAELLWAPDSGAFVVTESDGGNVGTWRVEVFVVGDATVRRVQIDDAVIASFKKHYRCIKPEEPNVGAVAWLGGSAQLLLAAEVPPHSSCPDMGKLRGYAIDAPSGRIVDELSEGELRRKWGAVLGLRLLN